MSLPENSMEHLKKNKLNLYNLFQKTKDEGTLPNSFYQTIITLVPNVNQGNPPPTIHST